MKDLVVIFILAIRRDSPSAILGGFSNG